jgi:hypothetical protein
MARKKYGRVFKTRAGRIGRYVYMGGRRVAFEVTKESYRAAKSGAKRYVAQRAYTSLKRRYK